MAAARRSRKLIEQAQALFAEGNHPNEIAVLMDVTPRTVYRYLDGAIAPIKRDVLGDSMLAWADGNEDAIESMRERCNEVGWNPQQGTLFVLALAEQAREELAEQTGGIPPTIRATLYRMMGVYGADKKIYEKLLRDSARARRDGVWPRDYFTDSSPDATDPRGGDFPVRDSLISAFAPLLKPWDAFVDTPFVLGVVVEARGGQLPLAGAIEQHLGFFMPVFAAGGSSAISRTFNIENVMWEWADQNDVEPVVLLITDYDPSGMVIANNLDEWLVGIETIRIGIDPHVVAKQQQEVIAADEIAEIEARVEDRTLDKNRHRRSKMWRDAVSHFGSDTEYQVEALDYATWARLIAEQLAALLEQRAGEGQHTTVASMLDGLLKRRAKFERGDELMADLSALARRLDGNVLAMAKALGRPLPGNPWRRNLGR